MQLFLLLAGLFLAAVALRGFENWWLRKLGGVVWLGACFWAAYALTGQVAWGAAAVSVWFLLPLVEILGRVRRIPLPLANTLVERSAPLREMFPTLPRITEDAEECGFERVTDTGWRWEAQEHFIRLLHHPEKRLRGAVCLIEGPDFSVVYVSISSHLASGKTLTTWNYPLPHTMRVSPEVRIHKALEVEDFGSLVEEHEAFLDRENVSPFQCAPYVTDEMTAQVEREQALQIRHNLKVGVIEKVGEESFRYSWKGCFFLWMQFLKVMVVD